MESTGAAEPGGTAAAARTVQLDVTGMTCVMCAAHIRRKLNKIDGVRASVNFASKVATVETSSAVSVADLCEVVRKAGYGAEERPATVVADADPGAPRADGRLGRLRALLDRR